MTDLDRARQLASEISDRVYSVQRVGTTNCGDERFVATLGMPDGTRIYTRVAIIDVNSTHTWEVE